MKFFLFFLFFLFPHIGLSETLEDLAKPFEGREIKEIIFKHGVNLNYNELLTPLPIRLGDLVEVQKLEQAKARLLERAIFSDVDIYLHSVKDGVRIQFLLAPLFTISKQEFSGNSALRQRELERASGLRPGTLLNFENLEQAKKRLLEKYHRAGYRQATIREEVIERTGAPEVIVRFSVEEGYRSRIGRVGFENTFPDDIVFLKEKFIKRASGQTASEKNIQLLTREFLVALRKEGYLQASVKLLEIIYQPLSGDIDLVFQFLPKQPISILFAGNDAFSAEELLVPLRLETRTVPFTPNAIGTLCREITKLYQRNGYFRANVSCRQMPASEERRIYKVDIEEGVIARLRKISFRGNRSISSRQLSRVLQIRKAGVWFFRRWVPGFLTQEDVETEVANLHDFYAQNGYEGTEISASLEYNEKTHGIHLIFSIHEIPQQIFKDVRIIWKNIFTRTSSVKVLEILPSIRRGEAYHAADIFEETERLRNVVRDHGFPLAEVKSRYDKGNGILDFVIEQGPFVEIGNISLQGNRLTHDLVILRELQVKSEEPWRPELIRKSTRQLYQLGLFRSVTLEPFDAQLDSARENLVVRVEERDTGAIDLGAGFDTEDGLQLSAELAQRNLGGNADTLVLGVDGFFKTGTRFFDAGRARATFIRPRIADSQTEFFAELFAQADIELIDQFSFDRFGATMSLRRDLNPYLKGSLGIRSFFEDVFDVNPDVIIGVDDEGETFHSEFRANLDLDIRDNVFNPRRGFRSNVDAFLATEFLGSEVNYLGVFSSSTLYTPLSSRIVWANNVQVKYLRAFGNTEVVPLSRRVFLGGRDSLRGFSRYAVGPRGENGNIVGGDIATVFRTELQVGISEEFSTVFFVDMGQAFLKQRGQFEGNPLNFSDIRHSPGLGFRYRTPIGPLSIEYGFALDREFGERPGRLNAGIGGSF